MEESSLEVIEDGLHDPETFVLGHVTLCRPLAIKICLEHMKREPYLASISRQVFLTWDQICEQREVLFCQMEDTSRADLNLLSIEMIVRLFLLYVVYSNYWLLYATMCLNIFIYVMLFLSSLSLLPIVSLDATSHI